jgi:hypothetical protein
LLLFDSAVLLISGIRRYVAEIYAILGYDGAGDMTSRHIPQQRRSRDILFLVVEWEGRVQTYVSVCGFCGEQRGTGAWVCVIFKPHMFHTHV